LPILKAKDASEGISLCKNAMSFRSDVLDLFTLLHFCTSWQRKRWCFRDWRLL